MITIRVSGHMPAARRVGDMGKRLGNLRPVFMVIQQDFRRIQRAQFDSQGRRGGGMAWKDITDKWRAYKVTHGFDARIMHMTHTMRDSFVRPRAKYAYFRIRGTSMTMGSSDPVAELHDPQRPLLGVRIADEREWSEWVAIYVAHGFLPRTGLA
jgi:hypothetical protein